MFKYFFKIARRLLSSTDYVNTTFTNRLIFLHKKSFSQLKKFDNLKEIIELGGGKVTENHFKSKIIVSDTPVMLLDKQKQKGVEVVVSKYIFDCLIKGSLLETTLYHPESSRFNLRLQ